MEQKIARTLKIYITVFLIFSVFVTVHAQGGYEQNSGKPSKIIKWEQQNKDTTVYELGYINRFDSIEAHQEAEKNAKEKLAGNLQTDISTIAPIVHTFGPYKNREGDTYLIVFIKRIDALKLYEAKISRSKADLETLVSKSADPGISPLTAYHLLKKAVSLASNLADDVKSAQSIGYSLYTDISKFITNIGIQCGKSRDALTFDVRVTSNSNYINTENIRDTIIGLLGKYQYKVSVNNATYSINVEIESVEKEFPDIYRITPSVSITVLGIDGKSIATYKDMGIDDGTSHTLWENAGEDATKKIQTDMVNFLSQLKVSIEQE